jgi:hypothetical protein
LRQAVREHGTAHRINAARLALPPVHVANYRESSRLARSGCQTDFDGSSGESHTGAFAAGNGSLESHWIKDQH